ncbi:MAG: UvrD-helicase domain-containing protein [Erysipelotrichia bacterium]|nr:UvrD-helicase domain-containing protein [Erysipelotrichia bacterium]
MKWSKEQLSAIKAFDENVLVNAGAGSGKTSVLSEHVIYLLENKIRLDRLLVLTFTNLASKEMKDRIRQKIADPKRGLTHLLNSVDAAHIETIDAFALFLVQKYHYVLKLPKNIRVLDQQIEEIQKRKILDEIFEEYY